MQIDGVVMYQRYRVTVPVSSYTCQVKPPEVSGGRGEPEYRRAVIKFIIIENMQIQRPNSFVLGISSLCAEPLINIAVQSLLSI